VARGEPTDRVREAEFQVHGLSAEELKLRLAAADDYANQAINSFSLADLETTHRSPRNDKTFTTGWCLLHALDQTALHLGHIQLTRQLSEQKEKRA
jgi:DinB superfamily